MTAFSCFRSQHCTNNTPLLLSSGSRRIGLWPDVFIIMLSFRSRFGVLFSFGDFFGCFGWLVGFCWDFCEKVIWDSTLVHSKPRINSFKLLSNTRDRDSVLTLLRACQLMNYKEHPAANKCSFEVTHSVTDLADVTAKNNQYVGWSVNWLEQSFRTSIQAGLMNT